MGMTKEQLARLSGLLDQSLPLTPTARRAWLDALSSEDRPLVQALREVLLADSPEAVSIGSLERPPPVAVDCTTTRRQAGERLGPYELLRLIGSGGMGEVWLARRADGAFERQVALKIPHLYGKPDEMTDRFARECRILASLEYPGIARLYDAGVDSSGVPYIAMEYVRGKPLKDWCDARKLDVPARLRVFQQVLDAVGHAHSHQILHLDLKPSNILVTAHGEVRLLDFGVARLLQGEARSALPTHAWGPALTPGYASPELLRGEPVDWRSDIYSLGVVLHELLTGARPRENLSDLSAGSGNALRGAMRDVLMKALAPAPADRYADAASFAAALRPFARGRMPLSRRARRLLAAGVAALAISAGTILWHLLHVSSGPQRIAVLPFENLGAPAQMYRARGFTETLLDYLTPIPGLQVISRDSSFQFDSTEGNPEEVARRLDVTWLLRGAVSREGERLRVSAQLIDGRNGDVVVSLDIKQPDSGFHAVLDEIAQDVAQALAVKLDVGMLKREQGGTNDLEAADHYWEYRQYLLDDTLGLKDPRETIQLLQKALMRDKRFVLAWDAVAGEHDRYADELDWRASQLDAQAPLAAPAESARLRKEAEPLRVDAIWQRGQADWARGKVEELAPESWITWTNDAYTALMEERWEDAERLARKVYESPPRTLEKIKPLGDVLFSMGHIGEVIDLEEREMNVEPLSMWISRNQQWNFYAAGKFTESENEYQRARENLQGSLVDPDSAARLRMLAVKDTDPAILRAAFDAELRRRESEGLPVSQLFRDIVAAAPDRARMLEVSRKAFEDGKRIDYLMADALGDADLAMEAYLKVWKDVRHKYISDAYWHPWLMPTGFRAHPKFKELMKEMGLADYWRKTNHWPEYCRPDGTADFVCQWTPD